MVVESHLVVVDVEKQSMPLRQGKNGSTKDRYTTCSQTSKKNGSREANLTQLPNIGVGWQETKPIRVVGAVDGRCWDRLARSSGLLYAAWGLSAVRGGKQRQFVRWIQVRTADGKVKLAKCLVDNGSEVDLVRKGLLEEDEAKVSSTPVQLEGLSGHRLDSGDREADLAVVVVKQSVPSVKTVTEE